MPSLSEISYNRDECISAVREYYNFLVGMYLDEAEVVEPPPGGWPSITTATMAPLGKTDEVVSLLRHLPYIREKNDDMYNVQTAAWCYFTNWEADASLLIRDSSCVESVKISTESASLYEILPPHVVSITKSPRDWTTLLIDTELGIGLWYECPGEVRDWPLREKVLEDPYDYEEDEEQAEWRGECGAWSIPDFFEVLKDQFRELKFVPKSPRAVVDVYISEGVAFPDMIEMLQGIYREHGWPDMEKYRKKDCLKAVQKALKERYPRLADSDWVEEE
ncbi:hypothetical protein A0O28_0001730 [Trichoderma guizhouense]|uniref:Uncharacterized protein n=1 Tax=Trichoderma guizhouense TaxID=1491466 RepID=A0A1T3CG99_9HYPO|nr:hypothetical protein A0O28_0001730 [Trichoderma guizhouense]